MSHFCRRYTISAPLSVCRYQSAVDEIARSDVFSPCGKKSPLSEFRAALNVPYEDLTDDDVEIYFRQERIRDIAE